MANVRGTLYEDLGSEEERRYCDQTNISLLDSRPDNKTTTRHNGEDAVAKTTTREVSHKS